MMTASDPHMDGRRTWTAKFAVGIFGVLGTGCAATVGGPPKLDPRGQQRHAPGGVDLPPLLQAYAVEAQAQVEQVAAETKAAKLKQERAPLSVWLRSRYRVRTAGSQSDQDLYEVLAIDYEDPAHPEMEAHFLGRGAFDLDGNSGALLQSINDSRGDRIDADVFEGYVEAGTKNGDTRVRIGRQSDYLTPEIAHFDGVSVRSRIEGPRGFEFGAYGGSNVTFDSSTSEDESLFGAFAQSRPWKGGRARLDWMHLNDDRLLGQDENDLVGLGLWQTWKAWTASAEYTRLEDRDRDLELRARWSDEAGQTSVQARYFQLLETQNQRALFLDPFTQALQTYFPFRQWGLSGWRALSEDVDLDLGFDVREVDDSGDIGTFNHDWRRYYATVTWRELIANAWTVSITGDWYDDDQNESTALGGDLSRDFGKVWKLSLGTYYSLYKYDFFTASERDDVQSYFTKLIWRHSDMWTFDLQYEYEDDDDEQYHTLRWGALCRF